MFIITNFEALGVDGAEFTPTIKAGLEPAATEALEDLCSQVFYQVNEAYNDAQGSDWYLYQLYKPEFFTFGAIEPEELIVRAKGWNQEIIDAFKESLVKAGVIDSDGIYTPAQIGSDTTGTHDLSKAARELDNNWFPFGAHGVYTVHGDDHCIIGSPYFTAQLMDADLEDITAHPEEYLIIEVIPK